MGMILVFAVVFLMIAGLVAFFVGRWFYWRWKAASGQHSGVRIAIVSLALLVFLSPYIVTKLYERSIVMARVHAPLRVAAVEYRNEFSGGVGPGANETGFVVYRLTEKSAEWAREQGKNLGAVLAGERSQWIPTPVGQADDHDEWHPYDAPGRRMSAPRPEGHPPTIDEYLEKYGFEILVPPAHYREADAAIQSEGSIYQYGGGGSVTIVDPVRGKVYFAYAG